MMLVEDYLDAIALLLPRAQREDIVAELRELVLSRIEAREAELGRSLTESEIEAVLREIGHPIVVAARYREGPQHLVGPMLYPYWLFAVKLAVTVQLVVAGIVFLVRGFASGDFAPAFGQAIGAGLSGAMTLIGMITAAAWLIERRKVHIGYLDSWRVRDLKLLRLGAWGEDWREEWLGWTDGSASRQRGWRGSPGAEALGQLVGLSVFLLWWIGLLQFGIRVDMAALPEIGVDPGPLAHLDLAALKAMLFWPVIAILLLSVARAIAPLAGPAARPAQGLLDIGLGAAELTMAAWIWFDSPFSAAVRVSSLAEIIERMRAAEGAPLAPILTVCVLVFTAFGVGRILNGLWTLALPRRRNGASASLAAADS
jgi:hypothetical protein